MITQIKKNRINTSELINFLSKRVGPNNYYFRTHPNKKDRINNLKEINFDGIYFRDDIGHQVRKNFSREN